MENGKSERINDDHEPEEEEEKMEKFFALLRSFRDARDRRRNELEMRKKKKKRKADHNEQSSWVPSFEWEDFSKNVEFRRPPLIFPSPCNIKNHGGGENGEQDDETGLNLKLTL